MKSAGSLLVFHIQMSAPPLVCTETGVRLLVWSSWKATATKVSVSLQTTRAERVRSWWVLLPLYGRGSLHHLTLVDIKSHRLCLFISLQNHVLHNPFHFHFLMPLTCPFSAGEQSICMPRVLLGTPSQTGTGTSFGLMSVWCQWIFPWWMFILILICRFALRAQWSGSPTRAPANTSTPDQRAARSVRLLADKALPFLAEM